MRHLKKKSVQCDKQREFERKRDRQTDKQIKNKIVIIRRKRTRNTKKKSVYCEKQKERERGEIVHGRESVRNRERETDRQTGK